MSDMKKLLKIVDESGDKVRIDEGVNVSINVSGDSPCDVGEVLAKVTNLSSPRPVTPDMMPAVSSPPPMPMLKALDIVGKGDGPAVPPAPPGLPSHPMEPHTAPETEGESPMMLDPSEEEDFESCGATMSGSEEELESLLSDAEGQLGIGDDEDDSSGYGPGDFADDEVDRLKDEPDLDESPMDLNSIISKHRQAFAAWKAGGEISDDDAFYHDLFAYYSASGEMPYGVQKGRDGDPDQWIDNQLSQDVGGQDESLLSAQGEEIQDEDMFKSKKLTMNSSYADIHERLKAIDQALQAKNKEFANSAPNSSDRKQYDVKDVTHTTSGDIKDQDLPMVPPGTNPLTAKAARMETVVREEWEKFKGD